MALAGCRCDAITPVRCQHGPHITEAQRVTAVAVQYWVPGLYYIGVFRERLEVLFPTRQVLPVLASVLFHPNNDVWSLLTQKMSQLGLLTPTSSPWLGARVGVQYR